MVLKILNYLDYTKSKMYWCSNWKYNKEGHTIYLFYQYN